MKNYLTLDELKIASDYMSKNDTFEENRECVIYKGDELTFENVPYLDLISSIVTCIKDKDGSTLYLGDKVSYAGKGEYVFIFFPEYGMFGLLDGDKPLGRKGSSTRYEPYILNKYHRNKIKKL